MDAELLDEVIACLPRQQRYLSGVLESYRRLWAEAMLAASIWFIRVELGINGFDQHRPHYFVAVGAQQSEDNLKLSNFFPGNQYVSTMQVGSFTYHDWDELVLTSVPDEIKGHKLLTTIRGRAREAHVIRAFRETPFPSSARPDQIMLTWQDDPGTSMTIQWRSSPDHKTGAVRFKKATDDKYLTVPAQSIIMEDRMLQNDRYIRRFTVGLTGLTTDTQYIYQVGHPEAEIWSEETIFRTAPPASSPFTFVWFGDTHVHLTGEN